MARQFRSIRPSATGLCRVDLITGSGITRCSGPRTGRRGGSRRAETSTAGRKSNTIAAEKPALKLQLINSRMLQYRPKDHGGDPCGRGNTNRTLDLLNRESWFMRWRTASNAPAATSRKISSAAQKSDLFCENCKALTRAAKSSRRETKTDRPQGCALLVVNSQYAWSSA
jgi:hypothetical protein